MKIIFNQSGNVPSLRVFKNLVMFLDGCGTEGLAPRPRRMLDAKGGEQNRTDCYFYVYLRETGPVVEWKAQDQVENEHSPEE